MEKTLSVREVAGLLGVSVPSVYQLCRQPDFPAVRISERRIVIPAGLLEVWLERKAQEGV